MRFSSLRMTLVSSTTPVSLTSTARVTLTPSVNPPLPSTTTEDVLLQRKEAKEVRLHADQKSGSAIQNANFQALNSEKQSLL